MKVFWVLILLFAYACHRGDSPTIRIIHAGSLAKVMKEAAELYEKENPDVQILSEAWGSKDGARQITELKKPCDIYISADLSIIETFLMPEHASWSIPFAGNEMVIAYTPRSRYAGEINPDNWYSILSRPQVLTARSSPDADPCGVRALLMMILAAHYYENDSITSLLSEKDQNFIRPKEADLIAFLEKNTVDYLYIYRSLAVQHGFLYLRLPEEINLSQPSLAAYYAKASFYTLGKTPDSKHLETGAPIVYGLTIPETAQNTQQALDFLLFFLNPDQGGQILERNGQNVLPPTENPFFEAIPEIVKSFAKPCHE